MSQILKNIIKITTKPGTPIITSDNVEKLLKNKVIFYLEKQHPKEHQRFILLFSNIFRHYQEFCCLEESSAMWRAICLYIVIYL